MSLFSYLQAGGLLLTVFLSTPQQVNAQAATPDHVFQVTQTVVEELKSLNGENFTTAVVTKRPDATAMPRHVLFLARDQWRKTQTLRFMNGLETHSLGNVKIGNVTPSEVKAFADRLLVQVRELRPAYGLGEALSSAPLGSGKKPTDVYESLLKISAELQALGIPATVPNDVYRVATTVTQALQNVALKQGLEIDLSNLPEERGRTPADAYEAALELLEDLEALTAREGRYAVPGAVWNAQPKAQGVSPDDVIQALSGALADIVAIMHSTGAGEELVYSAYVGGKTPSDVYNEIIRARSIIGSL